MSNRFPKLMFGPGGNFGFTPAGIAAFDDLRPAAVVRELIQNSLDAAQTAGVAKARIRFRLTRTLLKDVPGIREYKEAFCKAIKTQKGLSGGKLAGQAENVVQRIKEALESKEVKVLTVLDNGVGLNDLRMTALLSDGVSAKDSSATGTYGNGHATAIPASDLRYILYAGISKGNRKIGSGRAVLASHYLDGEKFLRSNEGRFIRDFDAGVDKLFKFSYGDGLSGVFSDALKQITADANHGTAVIIPAFNNFNESFDLVDMVFRAASANFFIAIDKGDLEVVVEDCTKSNKSNKEILDSNQLEKVLEGFKDSTRSEAFLSGKRAYEAFRAYKIARKQCITTSIGKIDIHLLEEDAGATRIELCRNGMWIVSENKIRRFYKRFTSQKPFNAVLSLNAKDGRKFHEYMRIAEGPLHDSILLKRLPKEQRKSCNQALGDVIDWIISNTTKLETEQYSPDDFLSLDSNFNDGTGVSGKTQNYYGIPVTRISRPTYPVLGGSKSRKKRKNEHSNRLDRRQPLLECFRVVSRPSKDKNQQKIFIQCDRDFNDAELRLVVDEALDATCDRFGQDKYEPLILSDVKIDNRVADGTALRYLKQECRAIRLGDLKTGQEIRVETKFQLTGAFQDIQNPSLQVQICKSDTQLRHDVKVDKPA